MKDFSEHPDQYFGPQEPVSFVVGVLATTLRIPGSISLKDKRHVVKSILGTVRAKFDVSCAEVDHLDCLQKAVLAFSVVSNDRRLANSVLDKVLNQIESNPGCEILDSWIDVR